MGKVIVIGGGASGLIAAIYASRSGNEVVLLERNSEPAKKILITGSGKCNYYNEDQDLSHYHTENKEELQKIITEENKREILSFFEKIGIVPKIKNQYYYPFSMQATSMKEALLAEVKACHVEIIPSFYVEEIDWKDGFFYINPHKEKWKADFLILATGSKAAPKTGSDGIGYTLASSLGHTIHPIYPALCPLIGKAPYFKVWDGVRATVCVSLYEDHHKVCEKEGEIQLTKYGVSGICIFDMSGRAAPLLAQHRKVSIAINFMPFLEEGAKSFLTKRNIRMKDRTIEQLLEGFLHYKVIAVIVKEAHLSKEQKWNEMSEKEKDILVSKLTHFVVPIEDVSTFEKAQVCTGGIPLTEIDPLTMESKVCKHLYVTGELIDVDGDCGGYNLGFAFITGMIAGKNIGGRHD